MMLYLEFYTANIAYGFNITNYPFPNTTKSIMNPTSYP